MDYCALVCIDIRNAFNSARWNDIVAALQKKKTPKYLTRMIRNYLRDRQIICEDDDCSIQEKMTCGAPQGSRIGPFLL